MENAPPGKAGARPSPQCPLCGTSMERGNLIVETVRHEREFIDKKELAWHNTRAGSYGVLYRCPSKRHRVGTIVFEVTDNPLTPPRCPGCENPLQFDGLAWMCPACEMLKPETSP